jgi:hypothetical protein
MKSADEMAALQRHLLERTKDLHVENRSRRVFESHTFVSMYPDIEGILDYPPDRNATNDACNEPAEFAYGGNPIWLSIPHPLRNATPPLLKIGVGSDVVFIGVNAISIHSICKSTRAQYSNIFSMRMASNHPQCPCRLNVV